MSDNKITAEQAITAIYQVARQANVSAETHEQVAKLYHSLVRKPEEKPKKK